MPFSLKGFSLNPLRGIGISFYKMVLGLSFESVLHERDFSRGGEVGLEGLNGRPYFCWQCSDEKDAEASFVNLTYREKFYIDPITLKIFRSISTSRKHMDDKFGPRDWSIYDSKGLGLNRKRSRKKPRRAAQAPFSIKDGVEGDAPAPAPAVGSSELTSAQDQKGKTPLVASDD
ncbi:hypothetical protein Dimus_005913 [Dionaea muscipula]